MALSKDEENVTAIRPSPPSPDLASKPDSDLEESYEIYQRRAGETLDPVEAKRVLRKIDRRILPILVVIYLLQYLDKNGINYASAYGLEEGTNLQGQQYVRIRGGDVESCLLPPASRRCCLGERGPGVIVLTAGQAATAESTSLAYLTSI